MTNEQQKLPLFASFVANVGGKSTHGSIVLTHDFVLDGPLAIQRLVSEIEVERGFDEGTVVLIGFQRLEGSFPYR